MSDASGGRVSARRLPPHPLATPLERRAPGRLRPQRCPRLAVSPRLSLRSQLPRSVRYFPCETLDFGRALSRPEDLELVSGAVEDVLAGFNRCLLTFGERGTGKTRLLFGQADGGGDPPQGLVGVFLAQVFEALVGRAGVRASAVALSAWLVRGNRAEDVFAAREGCPPRLRPEDMTLVDCPTLSVAGELLRRAVGRAATGSSSEDRAHLMVRVAVHQTRTADLPGEGLLGSLIVADLVGSAPVSGADFTRLSENDRIHRRVLALHLHSLLRVLEQMSEVSRRADESEGPVVTAARDSALTVLLCPVLQGNAATTVLMLLGNGEEHFAATKRTLTALEPVTRISSAVYSCTGVKLSALRPQNHSTVLPGPRVEGLLSEQGGRELLDLEKLAYGDYNYLSGNLEPNDRGKRGSEWNQQVGELMNQLHDALGESNRPEVVEAADNTRQTIDTRMSLNSNAGPTEAAILCSSEVETLQRTNRALLEEAELLRSKIEQLRHQIVEAKDASGEALTELEAQLYDKEVRRVHTTWIY